MREELVKFFIATDELEDKQLKILGWKAPRLLSRRSNKQEKLFSATNRLIAIETEPPVQHITKKLVRYLLSRRFIEHPLG